MIQTPNHKYLQHLTAVTLSAASTGGAWHDVGTTESVFPEGTSVHEHLEDMDHQQLEAPSRGKIKVADAICRGGHAPPL